MSSTELLTPIVDGAIKSIKFFNGRLLTGEDLTQEQTANREARNRLGRAMGEGVAFGLEVSINTAVTTPPTVTVQAGLAVNRHGKTLRLSSPVDVSLVQAASSTTTAPAAAPAAGSFAVCLPPSTTDYVTDGDVFLLTLAPIQTTQGRTQISGLGSGASACNTNYLVDAVELRLLRLDLSPTDLGKPQLRSLVAAKVFGYPTARAFAADPFGAQKPTTTPLDTLAGPLLTASDVPLATLYWTKAGGIVYVDMWSVRRDVAGPPGEWPWDSRLDERRLAGARAMLLQFQEQIDDMRAAPSPSTQTAQGTFLYLPPAGVLPIDATQGFPVNTFFGGLTVRDSIQNPIFIEGAKVESLLRASLGYPPIDCSSPEMVFVYHVRENRQGIDQPAAGVTPPLEYVVFASGQMPYFGDARFNVARWGYSSWS